MPKPRKIKFHRIAGNQARKVGGGYGYDIKSFPDCKPGGKNAPWDHVPPSGSNPNFEAAVQQVIRLVGEKVEQLNGLQFELEGSNPNQILTKMTQVLEELAVGLLMDKPGTKPTVSIPPELHWPLAGSYRIQCHDDFAPTGFKEFIVSLYFDNDETSRMVTNCVVEVDAQEVTNAAVPGEGNSSSSSSYLATSSSSR